MSARTLFLIFISNLILLAGCSEESPSQSTPSITEIYIEPTEPQSITNEGLVVMAEDINFGKIQLLWGTNLVASERFRFFIYVSKEPNIDNYNNFLATQLCNIQFNLCSPQKQTGCEIEQGLLYCLASTTRGIPISTLITEGNLEQKVWMVLRVCPFEATASDESCDQEARQFVLAKPCSKYRQAECLDQDPLEVSDFNIKGVPFNEEGTPVFSNTGLQRINFYPNWQSSWVSEQYDFQLDLVDYREPDNRVTLLLTRCNDRINCYPAAQTQCSFLPNVTGAAITCLGNPQTFQINHIDERHPVEDIPLVFELIAFDPLFQIETTLVTEALLIK